MKIYTIDDLAKGREVSLKDYPGYRGSGRGPDRQKRKKKTKNWISGGVPKGTEQYQKRKPASIKDLGKRMQEGFMAEKSLTLQDEKNIDLIRAMVDKNPDLQKKLEGPIKWVGQEGFDTCVAHLSGKKGITNAKALCGYLKDEARHKGELKKEHMGSQEKKKYQAKKGKK